MATNVPQAPRRVFKALSNSEEMDFAPRLVKGAASGDWLPHRSAAVPPKKLQATSATLDLATPSLAGSKGSCASMKPD